MSACKFHNVAKVNSIISPQRKGRGGDGGGASWHEEGAQESGKEGGKGKRADLLRPILLVNVTTLSERGNSSLIPLISSENS